MSDRRDRPTEGPSSGSEKSLRGPASWERLPELRWWRKLSVSRRRLHGEVLAFHGELSAMAAAHESSSWWKPVVDLTYVAADRAARGPVSPGFEALNAARRMTLVVLSNSELDAEAVALRSEAESKKLSGWRGHAIKCLLLPDGHEKSTSATEAVARLRVAQRIRDEGGQNTHRRHDVVALRFWGLLSVTIIAVASLVLLSWQNPLDLASAGVDSSTTGEPAAGEPATGEPVTEWSQWSYVFLLGVIGASVSAGLSLSKQPSDDSVPGIRSQTIPALFRPVFGGAAAIGSFAILSAGLLAGLSVTNGTILSVAFLAGFSERLIDSVSARVSAR